MKDVIAGVGIVLATIGAYQWYPPAAWMVAGVSCLVVAVLWGLADVNRRSSRVDDSEHQ